MNERTTNDLLTLYEEMEKYDFNKEYSVSVSIVDGDHDEEVREIHTNNEEKSLEPMNISGSDQITSIYFQNAHTNQRLNNQRQDNYTETHNVNNAPILPEYNVIKGTQNNSLTNLLPQNGNLNSHPTPVNADLSTGYKENYPHMNKNCITLDMLSTKIIYILTAYNYYNNLFMRSRNNELVRKDYCEKFYYVKGRYFNDCHKIVKKVIIPLGTNFNAIDFLHRTTCIAQRQFNFNCKYKDVETVYNDIISSFYTTITSHKNMPSTKKIDDKLNTLRQEGLQSGGHYNVNKRCHNNNTIQTNNNGPISIYQQNCQSKGNYNNIPQTSNEVPNSILEQNSKNYSHSTNTAPTMDNRQSSALLELLQSDGDYNKINQVINNEVKTNVQPNYKNGRQSSNVTQKTNKEPNSFIPQNVQNELNYNNLLQNSPNQTSMNIPTTCVYQYTGPDYEVRLDVNTELLNDVHLQNPLNNNCNIDDPTHTKKPCIRDDLRKSAQESLNAPAHQKPCQNMSQVLQEPVRSTSRDSGFMSPCYNQNADLYHSTEGQDATSPYITHVTSLHPEAIHIPIGSCHVCGDFTKKKCIGCFKYYYCSNKCQTYHWSNHQFDCTSISDNH